MNGSCMLNYMFLRVFLTILCSRLWKMFFVFPGSGGIFVSQEIFFFFIQGWRRGRIIFFLPLPHLELARTGGPSLKRVNAKVQLALQKREKSAFFFSPTRYSSHPEKKHTEGFFFILLTRPRVLPPSKNEIFFIALYGNVLHNLQYFII